MIELEGFSNDVASSFAVCDQEIVQDVVMGEGLVNLAMLKLLLVTFVLQTVNPNVLECTQDCWVLETSLSSSDSVDSKEMKA